MIESNNMKLSFTNFDDIIIIIIIIIIFIMIIIIIIIIVFIMIRLLRLDGRKNNHNMNGVF